MKRVLFACAVLCALTLTGCIKNVRPLPVSQTSTKYTTSELQKLIAGNLPAADLETAKNFLRDYEIAYVEQADARITRYYKGSDTGIAGGIVGMLGGLTKSPQTAIAGLLINAGGNLEEQRYQLRVQAGNFNKAANAMRCMQRALIPDPIPDELKGDAGTKTIFTQQVNDHIDRIKMRLRDQQFSITPNPVNTDQIREAIQKQLQGKDEHDVAVAGVAQARANKADRAKSTVGADAAQALARAEAAETAALAVLRDAAAKEFDGRLGQCSAG